MALQHGRSLVPPLSTSTLKDRMHKWLAENPSSPLTPDDSMGEQLERRVGFYEYSGTVNTHKCQQKVALIL